jgi:hypothetical protein
MLAVDAFVSQMCSPYATPGTIAANLKQYGAAYRQCYSWLGPNQQGVNESDPSNPGGCVPDPGGAPPGRQGPQTSAPACPASLLSANPPNQAALRKNNGNSNSGAATGSGSGSGAQSALPGTSGSSPTGGGPSLQGALGKVTSAIGAATGAPTVSTPAAPATPSVPAPDTSSSTSSGTPTAQQAQQLLNYLLSP